MLTSEQIEQLATFDGQGSPVLSVYLDLDPASRVRQSYRALFEDLVKAARARVEATAQAAFTGEVERVTSWLESQPPRGKGLAVFSCTPRGLWRPEDLAVRVMSHLVFEPHPDVAPLLRILDEYERYSVALVDKEKAQLFSVFAGEIEQTDALKDDVPGKHDQGGVSQRKYQAHHEVHVLWHLKRVAQRLADLHRRRRFDRIILAGPEEATSGLRRLLPRTLAHRVIAVIPGQMFATDQEILDKTLEVERRVERETEERLLREVVDNAGPAGRSVLGVRPTLAAIGAGLVEVLVVSQGAQGDGSECPNCERLDAGTEKTCAICGAAMRPVHDVFHRAMQRTQLQAGRVEVMVGDAEKRLTELGGGLGALLHYPSPVPQAVTR